MPVQGMSVPEPSSLLMAGIGACVPWLWMLATLYQSRLSCMYATVKLPMVYVFN